MTTHTFSGNAESAALAGPGTEIQVARGVRNLRVAARGTFDSGTLTLQVSVDNGDNWISSATTFTAAGVGEFNLHPGELLRASLAGAGSPSVVIVVQ